MSLLLLVEFSASNQLLIFMLSGPFMNVQYKNDNFLRVTSSKVICVETL